MIKFTIEDDEGVEVEHSLPGKMEVCDRCEGYGTHLTPSIRQHAYSIEEFNEAFFDDEDREHYFKRGGKYDVQCEKCNGARVIEVPDEDEINRHPEMKAIYEKYEEQVSNKARWDAEDRYTRRMENGGIE